MSEPLGTIGILGAGQLAMMLSAAAADLGVGTHVFAPERALLRPVGDRLVTGDLADVEALAAFADEVDVITFETENIPIEPVLLVSDRALVRPSAETVRISQDRLAEKRFVDSVGLTTAPFASLGGGDGRHDDPTEAATVVGAPAIVKTRRFGYDGKGQARIETPAEAGEAWRSLAEAPSIVEAMVPFVAEISVVAARDADGGFVPFDPGLNHHRDGVLVRTAVPAPSLVSPGAVADALAAARTILDALDYVGVAGIEFFVVDGDFDRHGAGHDGDQAGQRVLVNEIAPRVHNSGHWTQLGCAVSQFEQHVRAITGRPLADGARHADVEMINLLGDGVDDLSHWLADPGASIVLYGKTEVRPGRKMGHVNRLLPEG